MQRIENSGGNSYHIQNFLLKKFIFVSQQSRFSQLEALDKRVIKIFNPRTKRDEVVPELVC